MHSPQLACTVEKETWFLFLVWQPFIQLHDQTYTLHPLKLSFIILLFWLPLNTTYWISQNGYVSVNIDLFPPFLSLISHVPCQQATGPAPPILTQWPYLGMPKGLSVRGKRTLCSAIITVLSCALVSCCAIFFLSQNINKYWQGVGGCQDERWDEKWSKKWRDRCSQRVH